MIEPTYACPKCGNPFPMSQLHAHYQTCPGKVVQQQQQIQQWLQSPFPQQPIQAPLYVPQSIPEHQHRWIENDTFKVCPDCKSIKVKLRGSWQIFIRYGFKLFWIQMIIALAIAFSLTSAFGVHR